LTINLPSDISISEELSIDDK